VFVCVAGTCARSGCLRRRTVNQLTGQLHDHCSIDCMRQDQATTEAVSNPAADENGTALPYLRGGQVTLQDYIAVVCPALRPYQFGPMCNSDVTRSQ